MPKNIEAQGVTVDEAIQTALNLLGLGRDSVEIEIIHHPRSGFLGIGARRAKVRATMREQVMKDGEEFDMSPDARSRGRRRRRSGRRRTPRGGDEARPRESRPGPTEAGSRGAGGEGRRAGPAPRGARPGGAETAGGAPERRTGEQRGRGRGRRGGRGRSGGDRRPQADIEAIAAGESVQAERAAAEPPGGEPAAEGRTRPREQMAGRRLDPEALRSRAHELTTELARQMGVEATISTQVDENGNIAVTIESTDDGALLIGRRGTTLDALEHIINRMTTGADPGARVRVALDVCGYRDRRKATLVEVAMRLKEHAIANMRRVQITPLSPHERVIFQEALSGDDSVATRILGSGFYRRVLIIPRGQENAAGAAEEFNEEGKVVEYPGSEPTEEDPVDEPSQQSAKISEEGSEGSERLEGERPWSEQPCEIAEKPRVDES